MFSAFATPAACHAISKEKRSSFACSRHSPRQRLAMRSQKRREAHSHVLSIRHGSGLLCDLRREEKLIRMFSACATAAACYAISEEKRSSFACSRHSPRQPLAMRCQKRREVHSHVLGIRHASRLPCDLRRQEKLIRMFSACATAAACHAIAEDKRSSFACSRHSPRRPAAIPPRTTAMSHSLRPGIPH